MRSSHCDPAQQAILRRYGYISQDGHGLMNSAPPHPHGQDLCIGRAGMLPGSPGDSIMRTPYRICLAIAALAFTAASLPAEENYADWEILKNPFPSTGGGGIMIDGYNPVIKDGKCRTDFTASDVNGTVYYNMVEFETVETQGGILCTNGKWRARDGSMAGTTPFRMFIKDGVVRRAP
jgi:hypothetical protein